ncbi:MAG: monomeric [FeFe] hydrogenase [Bacteroides sp.]|nr:monomeric [FeFe] hydrogenase [Bacteroides sp.]
MAYNESMLIRRDLLTRVCKLMQSGTLRSEIDRVPLVMRPRYSKDVSRCCVYKDRAVIKYRLMAILGYDIRDEKDELTPLSEYARMAEERKEQTTAILTVVDLACSSCVQVNYVVTNMCHGCIGHPCTFACHKNAISIHQQAYIDPGKCVSCGLCMKACPFNAIIYQAVPCEQSCPVNAISKDEHGVEHIDEEKCIYCGRCREACPYGAIMEKTYLTEIYRALKSDKKVVALVAPSIMGQFPVHPGKVVSAIKALGFDQVVEVAEGANITAQNEAAEFEERVVEGGQKFMTTSCCHAYTELVHKHLKHLEPYVSHTHTPVYYTAQEVKAKDPACITVFFAPCLSKRHEAMVEKDIDWVLSYEELGAMLTAAGIDVQKCEEEKLVEIDNAGRAFPYTKGVTEAVLHYSKNPQAIRPFFIDGVDKAVIKSLKTVEQTCGGPDQPNMIEFMVCQGGCVNGCASIANPRTAARQIQTFIKENDTRKAQGKDAE